MGDLSGDAHTVHESRRFRKKIKVKWIFANEPTFKMAIGASGSERVQMVKIHFESHCECFCNQKLGHIYSTQNDGYKTAAINTEQICIAM